MFDLPPLTAALKPLSPYLQRAEEVKSQDRIVAYWCKSAYLGPFHPLTPNHTPGAYYAAQLGLSLNAQDMESRKVLFELVTVLERMKKDIGPNDAVDVEAASSAYVENFALKVFSLADNEERKEGGNR
jgi:vacuolar protein sorting-associated protein VTA1